MMRDMYDSCQVWLNHIAESGYLCANLLISIFICLPTRPATIITQAHQDGVAGRRTYVANRTGAE